MVKKKKIWKGGNTIPKHACPEAKGNNPTTGLCSVLVTYSGEILTTAKSHKNKPEGLFQNYGAFYLTA